MPTVILEPVRAGEYIVGEESDNRSREVGLIAGAATSRPRPGTVLGRVTASGKFVALAPAATDGSQNAAAIYFGHGDVAGADLRATLHVRDMSANGWALTWPAGITAGQQSAAILALAGQGIIVRA